MRNWVRDLLILPLVVGVIVAAVTFGLPLLLRDAQELSYVVDGPAAYLDDPALGHVKVEINGVAVSELFAYKIRLWNSGDIPLQKLPVSFVFEKTPSDFQVFSTSHATTPRFEFGAIDEDVVGPARRRFVYELLNPGDQDIVTFLTNARPELEVFAKAANLTVIAAQPDSEGGDRGQAFDLGVPSFRHIRFRLLP